jgi:hypothetical protein
MIAAAWLTTAIKELFKPSATQALNFIRVGVTALVTGLRTLYPCI